MQTGKSDLPSLLLSPYYDSSVQVETAVSLHHQADVDSFYVFTLLSWPLLPPNLTPFQAKVHFFSPSHPFSTHVYA